MSNPSMELTYVGRYAKKMNAAKVLQQSAVTSAISGTEVRKERHGTASFCCASASSASLSSAVWILQF